MADLSPIVTTLTVGPLQTNCYLITCPTTRATLAIDPADEPQRILRAAERVGARLEQILLTHCHPDHVVALPAVRQATGARVLAHRLDARLIEDYCSFFGLQTKQPSLYQPDTELEGGEEIAVGSLTGNVLHTPGHSPGSISLQMGNLLFSGDTLFAMGIGRVDLPGGDLETILSSLQQLFRLPDETQVYPGHGPATTIGAEKAENPYL